MTQDVRERPHHRPAREDQASQVSGESLDAESPRVIERRMVVPLVNELPHGRVVYDPSMLRWALAGGLAGAVLLGLLGWAVASGLWAIRDVGQFGASGPAVATFTASGVGAALGALAGAISAVARLPSREPR